MEDLKNIYYQGPVLWSQIDANQHMRHSAYADFAAQARIGMLQQVGLSPETLYRYQIGPILFREELIYLREVSINDTVIVTCEVTRSRPDGSRWAIRHEIYRGDGVKAAVVIAEGSWIGMQKRKLAILPKEMSEMFRHAPKSENYVEEKPKEK